MSITILTKIITYDWPSMFQTFFLELSSLIVMMFEVNEPFDLLHCFIITIIVVGDGFIKVLNVLIEIIKNIYSATTIPICLFVDTLQ